MDAIRMDAIQMDVIRVAARALADHAATRATWVSNGNCTTRRAVESISVDGHKLATMKRQRTAPVLEAISARLMTSRIIWNSTRSGSMRKKKQKRTAAAGTGDLEQT